MATLDRKQIEAALRRLGELATADGLTIELAMLGGGVMVLEFSARESTRDIDVVIFSPQEPAIVRKYASVVADELGWNPDWLNDAAKGFLIGFSAGPTVFDAPGIHVTRPSTEQLLAMKLCAWRDDVDIADAQVLLKQLPDTRDRVWERLTPFLQPGRELMAAYAFEDLWEMTHGQH